MQVISTKGWSPGNSANISTRVPETDHVCIKSADTNMAFGALDPDSNVVVIDLDETQVHGVRKSSMVFRFHLGIYKVRPDVGAVLHVHPPYATSYAVAKPRDSSGLRTWPICIEESAAARLCTSGFE